MAATGCKIKRNHDDHGKWYAHDEEGNFIDKDKYQGELMDRLEDRGYKVEVVGR